DHLRGAGADDLEKSGARTSRQVRRTQFRKAVYVESHDRAEQAANPETAQREIKPQVAGTSACSVWRGIVGGVYGRRFHGTGDAAIFLRIGNSRSERLRSDRGGYFPDSERFQTISSGHRWNSSFRCGVKN